MSKCKACKQDQHNLSMFCPVTGGFHSMPKPKTYSQTELDEALRKQREACLQVWIDSMEGDDLHNAILNASINGK